MNAFTLGYLARLEVWGLAAAAIQGGLILVSWRVWDQATAAAAATLRHRLACAHFVALAAAPLLTLAILHWTVTGMGAAARGGSPGADLPSGAAGWTLALPLAILWLGGAAAMTLRLFMDAWRVARLSRAPAPAELVEAVRRLGGGRTVPQVRVADVLAPQIVGLRRPVLLTPHALRLPSAQRDAVLLHELAHVWRGDFGWNLIHRMLLALLWFHPAAWALYGALSREREVCCDALAVRHGASAAALARALVRLAEDRVRPGLAMAIASPGDLATRIHRLLGPQASPRGRSPGPAVALSALCLLATGAGRLGLADPSLGALYAASAFGPTISIMAHDAAGAFALRIRQGRVVAASVGTLRLPQGRILQQGDRVTLLGDGRQPIVALTVTPQGRIRWKART